MVGADQPQIVRPSALHESQIACVIDDAGEIRIFVIHAHGLMVPTVANLAIESIHGELFTDSAERHQSFRTPTQPFIGVNARAAARGRASVARMADREARADQSKRPDRSPPSA